MQTVFFDWMIKRQDIQKILALRGCTGMQGFAHVWTVVLVIKKESHDRITQCSVMCSVIEIISII